MNYIAALRALEEDLAAEPAVRSFDITRLADRTLCVEIQSTAGELPYALVIDACELARMAVRVQGFPRGIVVIDRDKVFEE